MTSCNTVISITAIAIGLAEGKTPEELEALSCLFIQLGDTLSTIASEEELAISGYSTKCC